MTENYNFLATFVGSLVYQISTNHKIIYGIHGNVHLWPYVSQALSQINMIENINNLTSFGTCLSH
jgi:hypothetical protein